MKEEIPDWFVFECDCRVWITDYPFVSCQICGKTYCGSEEQLKEARRNNKLIKLLKSGFGEPDINQLSHELDRTIAIEWMHHPEWDIAGDMPMSVP